MKHLTKLTSLLVLTVGLAAAPLAAAEPGHDDGPHPEQQSPHMKKPVSVSWARYSPPRNRIEEFLRIP